MKLGIIGGAGLLGATTAYCVAREGIAREIMLADVRENVAISHAMDIEQAVCEYSSVGISAAGIDDLQNCDIVLNAAGVPEMSAASRDDYLAGNMKIICELAENISRWSAAPVILSATNPIDVLNYALYNMTGLPRERFIGFSRNDTLRFKWAIAKETGIPASQIEALVIGEHGEGQVPVFSSVRVGASETPDRGHRPPSGEDIDTPRVQSAAGSRIQYGAPGHTVGGERESNSAESKQKLEFAADRKERIIARVNSWFGEYQKLNSGRSSGWTSAVGLCRIIEAISTDSDEVIPCSVIPGGEYGFSGLSIGLPVRLGRAGVREIVEVGLDGEEKASLSLACAKVKKLIGM